VKETMFRSRWIVPVLVLFAAPAWAEEKVDAQKLKGSWIREVDGFEIIYKFKDEKKLQATVGQSGADQRLTVEIDYALDKDGKLTGTITKIESGDGGGGHAQVGQKFTFKITLGKDSIKISDFEGVGDDNVKRLVEGEYKKKID
jgi:hypothetical protein